MRAAASLLCVALLAGCAERDSGTHTAVQVLEAANAAKDKAMVAGDAAALENFYTADYQGIDDDGTIHDKRGQVEFMTGAVDLLSATSADVEVRMLSKNVALVTGRVHGTYRQDGKHLPFNERLTQ